jgi:hypothetical protein
MWCIIALYFHTADGVEKKQKLIRFAIGSLAFGTFCFG